MLDHGVMMRVQALGGKTDRQLSAEQIGRSLRAGEENAEQGRLNAASYGSGHNRKFGGGSTAGTRKRGGVL